MRTPSGDPLTVSVVMPTYNRRQAVCRVVEILLVDPSIHEIVVVVDGCRDGTIEALEERAETDTRLRPTFVDNGGEGLARQRAAQGATGDVLLVLDDDVEPAPGLASGHLRHHLETPGLVVLGYMPTEVPEPRHPGCFATALYAREYEAVTRQWDSDPTLIFSSFWAGNFSIRREDALLVGFAAPERFPYHEDQVFGFRCREAGLSARFDRSLLARHEHSRTFDAFVSDAQRQGEGAWMIHQRYGGGPFPFVDERPFPAMVQRLIRIGASNRSRRMVQGILRMVVRASGRAHLFAVETYSAMVLRSIVQREKISGLEFEESHHR